MEHKDLEHAEDLLSGFRRNNDASGLESQGFVAATTENSPSRLIEQQDRWQAGSGRYACLIAVLAFVVILMAILAAPPFEEDSRRMVDMVVGFLFGIGIAAVIQFFSGLDKCGIREPEPTGNQPSRRDPPSPC